MHEEPFSSQTPCAPTAAKAAVLQLAEGASSLLKNTGEPDTRAQVVQAQADPDGIAAALEGAIRSMAGIKNVALAAETPRELAAGCAATIGAATASALARGDEGAVVTAAALVNRLLDVIAARRIIELIWAAEGFADLDPAWLTAQAQAWTAHGVAQHLPDNRFRWPDPIVMLKGYLAARSGGRVSVVLPEGSARLVAWFVDPVRCRLGTGREISLAAFTEAPSPAHARQPVPQLIRCPGLPGTPSFRFPDGRCIRTQDGATVTTWWKDGRLHPDPADGPALHRTDGVRTSAEYWAEGQVHRAHDQGPAVTYSHYEGEEIAGEEYFEQGLRHRPSGEGPAWRLVDRDGTIVREIWYEQGERHRDDGPAWRGREDGCVVEEYYRRGRLHRDESEGPAVIAHDEATGALRKQVYYRDGAVHREIGAAEFCLYADGTATEAWYREGVLHRDPADGPAVTWRNADTGESGESFHSRGDLHRDPAQGPAVVTRDAEGAVTAKEFWQGGAMVEREPAVKRRARRAAKKPGKSRRRRS